MKTFVATIISAAMLTIAATELRAQVSGGGVVVSGGGITSGGNNNFTGTNNTFAASIFSTPTNTYTAPDLISTVDFSGVWTVSDGYFNHVNVGDDIFIPTNSAGATINQQGRIIRIQDSNTVWLYFTASPTGCANVNYQIYPGSYLTTDISGFHLPHQFTLWSAGINSEGTIWSSSGNSSYNTPFGGGFELVDASTLNATPTAYRLHSQSFSGSQPFNGDHMIIWSVEHMNAADGLPFFIDPNALSVRNGVLADGTLMVGGLTNYNTGPIASGSVVKMPGIQTTGTATATITATGFTNTLGTNIYVNCIGSAVAVTIKNNAGTAVATNTVLTGGTIIPLQAGGSISAAAGLSGTYWVQ